MSYGYEITFDNSASATAVPELIVQTVDRDLLPGVRDEYIEVPGYTGSFLFPEADGDRSMQMTCQLVADTTADRRAAVRALAQFLRKTTMKRLIVSDEPDRFWLAKINAGVPVTERQARGLFQLTWRTSPYAESITTYSTSVSATSAPDTFSIDIGNSQVEIEPVIELTATENSADGFELTIGGTVLDYAGSVTNGQVKTISCRTATVVTGAWADEELETGLFNGATLDMATVTGAFGVIGGEGGNDITLDRMNGVMRIVWRERYL